MSKDSKDSFVFYRDWYYAAASCDEQTQLKLYRAIMEYVFLDIEPNDPAIQLAFSIIKQRLDADLGKWEKVREKRKEAGKRGAKKRWGDDSKDMAKIANDSKCHQVIANEAVNVNVNVDNDTNVSMLSDKENTLTSVKENAAEAAARAVDNMEKRKKTFYDELIPFLGTYGKKMIREFYDYWTEPNKSGTRFRKELERTWSTERRLATWASREKITPTNPEQSPAAVAETRRRSELTAEEEKRAQQLREARERMIKEREQQINQQS